MRNIVSLLICSALLSTVYIEQAHAFSDVDEEHFAYDAIMHWKNLEVLQGYDDGTFRPDTQVNRAEALKILSSMHGGDFAASDIVVSVFDDVPEGSWYLPYVEDAHRRGVIDGPPAKTSFYPSDSVLKVEFLKMLLLNREIDPLSFDEIRLPLSADVNDIEEWYYPYMRYALTASLLRFNEEEQLYPAMPLTRGEVAYMTYALKMYLDAQRSAQLLDQSALEIERVSIALLENDIQRAEFASARALLLARGAHASIPENTSIQSALKITEAFRALVRSSRVSIEARYDDAIRIAGEGWNLAARAATLDEENLSTSEAIQELAKKIADEARQLQSEK